MKRICIDARFYAKRHTGVSRYTRALIHHLQKIETPYEFTVVLTPEDYDEWPKNDLPKNWHVKVLNIPFYTRGEQIGFLNYLNHEKFDLVHFTMFNHPIRYNRPFVVTIHDLTMTLFPVRSKWHYRFLAYRYTMLTIKAKVKNEANKTGLMSFLCRTFLLVWRLGTSLLS